MAAAGAAAAAAPAAAGAAGAKDDGASVEAAPWKAFLQALGAIERVSERACLLTLPPIHTLPTLDSPI